MSRRYDHDAVLDLWADGRSGPEIEARLKMHASTVCQIVRGARRRGDPRAVWRSSGPTVRRVGYLPHGLVPAAMREARARKTTLPAFCISILTTVIRDGLVGAVLDDKPPAQVLHDPRRNGSDTSHSHSPSV